MRRVPFLLLLLVPVAALAWPWSRDMMDQPSLKPQEGMVPFPERSVPVGGYPTPVRERAEAEQLRNPVAATPASVTRGAQHYAVFCAPCHGSSGKGDGPVGKKLPLRPIDLTTEQVAKLISDGRIFAAMTFGGALMPSYRNDLSPEERWDVINYVRKGLRAPARSAERK